MEFPTIYQQSCSGRGKAKISMIATSCIMRDASCVVEECLKKDFGVHRRFDHPSWAAAGWRHASLGTLRAYLLDEFEFEFDGDE